MEHGEPTHPGSSGMAPDPSPPPVASQVFGSRLDLARRYWQLLATEGITRGLIGPREVPRLWDRHIINCAVIADVLDVGESVIDIGSGAGLPGIPLAIARPDLTITLVEPLLRRSAFLSEAIAELGLSVTVVRGRAEEKSVRSGVGRADAVTSRAVAPLERLARWSVPLISPGGRLVAIKGSSAEEEIVRDGDRVRRLGLTNLTVTRCGQGLIDPPTTVVVGTLSPSGHAVTRRSRRGAQELGG